MLAKQTAPAHGIDPTHTIAHLVAEHGELAPIFQKHRIDFCCKGEVSLEAVCQQSGLDLGALTDELQRAIENRAGDAEADPRTLTTAALIAHIIARYHVTLRQTLPFVRTLATKVRHVHGAHNGKLIDLDELVAELCEGLLPHLDMEETSLFPRMMLREAHKEQDAIELDGLLTAMHDEHLVVGKLLEDIRAATEDFSIPDWACGSYTRLFKELERIEGEVLRHVHLENHVLKPRFAA